MTAVATLSANLAPDMLLGDPRDYASDELKEMSWPRKGVRTYEVEVSYYKVNTTSPVEKKFVYEGSDLPAPIVYIQMGGDCFASLHVIHTDVHKSYQERIAFLDAAALTEGVALNKTSKRDFWAFFAITSFSREAELVLSGSGDVCAIWEDEDENYLDLQFVGNQEIIYVIFKRRSDKEGMIRTSGTDTFAGVLEKISEYGLEELVGA